MKKWLRNLLIVVIIPLIIFSIFYIQEYQSTKELIGELGESRDKKYEPITDEEIFCNQWSTESYPGPLNNEQQSEIYEMERLCEMNNCIHVHICNIIPEKCDWFGVFTKMICIPITDTSQ